MTIDERFEQVFQEDMRMKFPYGMCDFKTIVTEGYVYCDRTAYIPLIEQGRYLLFLRPRRFGKSLWLSTLMNYYNLVMRKLYL